MRKRIHRDAGLAQLGPIHACSRGHIIFEPTMRTLGRQKTIRDRTKQSIAQRKPTITLPKLKFLEQPK